ncbi:DinB family protein [Olivibacter sp. SDN3]|uniref:DinB family protein n=1 Tax=Olivibacter sp. SDN3 TaxID=2764720 RepID=UPI00165177EE|nr:DinB family protein [Olivibacter sp. SDN3]QNL50227.1 DinB family protein [Olivibacter sp. SDN3]
MEPTITHLIKQLKDQLLDRFTSSGAHADLFDALHGLSWEQAGQKQKNFPYNIWQLAEHIRIAQYDIVEFCRNPEYRSPDWPLGYWPKKSSPEGSKEWKQTLDNIKADHELFVDWLKRGDADILKRFEHGTGQSLFNEALLIMDHNAYHVGQIILIRKLNGWWH